MWTHSWLCLDLWCVALTAVLVIVDLERIMEHPHHVLPLDYVCLSTNVCIAYQSYWILLLHHVNIFLYISIISNYLVKIVSDLLFGYLRYPLCYCLILGFGIYENASKNLLKIILKNEEGLYAVFSFTYSSKWCSFQWSLRISFGRWYEKWT